MTQKLIAVGWLVIATLFLLYSFTQVDLGLTLTSASVIAGVQQSFQYVGYFNRSLSAFLYVGIIILMFGMYLITLRAVNQKILQRKHVWALVVSVSIILFVAYNAFSHDIFNYIFDARIISHYGQDPYTKRALDFPQDPMLAFMHWTHRTYPYGPVWLAVTVPLTYIAGNFFLISFYLIKLLALAVFLGSVLMLEKIITRTKTVDPLFGITFFALNPLILSEFLVSAHNDMTMIFLALVSLYLLLIRRVLFGLIFLMLSIGVKFATVLMIPSVIYVLTHVMMRHKFDLNRFGLLLISFMVLAVILASYRTNYQPWYLIYVLPFAALYARKFFILIPTLIISAVSLFHYVPYLYTGNWDYPIPIILWSLIGGAVIASLLSVGFYVVIYNRK